MAGDSEIVVHIDGASRGNPGPAAYAVVMESPEGAPVAAFSKYLGEATNNFAEYQALLAALEYALSHQQRGLRVLTDSELVARQVAGHYKVKSADLKPLHERVRRLASRLERFSIQHVPREQNRQADRLANKALDDAERRDWSPRVSEQQRSPKAVHPPGSPEVSEPLRASATYRQGTFKLHGQLPLADGEEVELEIRRPALQSAGRRK